MSRNSKKFQKSTHSNIGSEDLDDGTTVSGTIYTSRANRRNNIDNNLRKANNIQRNESLDKYRSMTKGLPYSIAMHI